MSEKVLSNYTLLWPFDSCCGKPCRECGKRLFHQRAQCESCRRRLGLKPNKRDPARQRARAAEFRQRQRESEEGRIKSRLREARNRLKKKGIVGESATALARLIAVELELKHGMKRMKKMEGQS